MDITKTLDNLNNILVKSADDAAPKTKKGKRRLKLQVMNDDIRIALSEKKAAFFKWKEMGRPNNPNNHYLKDKKRTTRLLRKEYRLEIARRINARQEVIQARTSDRNTFYKLIRKQRGQFIKPIDHLTVEGETYSNDLIMEGWRTHFHKLAMKTHNETYDLEFLDNVKEEVKVILELCKSNFFHQSISEDEMKAAIMSLNRNKAADFYGIKAEYIIYGGKMLHLFLQKLLDKVFETGDISDILKIGTLFPVYKNEGDHKDAKFYRGITVTPIYSKTIEKIIKSREKPKILEVQNPLQKGFTKDTSPLLCELLIEEFERENKDLKPPTYIAFWTVNPPLM